jgi:hypothetical protein
VEKGQGDMGKTTIFFLPSLTIQNGTDREVDPVEEGGAPATRCAATAGKWGETKRRSRATDSTPYLGLGCSGEADRRRWAVCNPERHGRRWWWRWRARRGGGIGHRGAGRGGEPVRPLYRRKKVGSVKIFELEELRWPSMAVGRKISVGDNPRGPLK